MKEFSSEVMFQWIFNTKMLPLCRTRVRCQGFQWLPCSSFEGNINLFAGVIMEFSSLEIKKLLKVDISSNSEAGKLY